MEQTNIKKAAGNLSTPSSVACLFRDFLTGACLLGVTLFKPQNNTATTPCCSLFPN